MAKLCRQLNLRQSSENPSTNDKSSEPVTEETETAGKPPRKLPGVAGPIPDVRIEQSDEADDISRVNLRLDDEQVKSSSHYSTSSPFARGSSEVLIGKDSGSSAADGNFQRSNTTPTPSSVRTKAVIENQKFGSQRKDVDSFVKVGSPLKLDEVVIRDRDDSYCDKMMVMMGAMDGGPHRELPVDVPDSFVARNKTPPRYPPPKRPAQITMNGCGVKLPPSTGVHIPPNINNNTIVHSNDLNSIDTVVPDAVAQHVREPTREQITSIKKYQDDLNLRKEEEERISRENDFLNRSLRDSKKLQALESKRASPCPAFATPSPATGFVNDAFTDDETYPQDEVVPEINHKVIDYGQLVDAVKRLQQKLDRRKLEGVRLLIQSADFQQVIQAHNTVQKVWPPKAHSIPLTSQSKSLISDCLSDLQGCSSADASKLTEFLARDEVEELLGAHDEIAQNYLADSIKDDILLPIDIPPSNENIQVITVEKTTEPLGATIKWENNTVVIGRVVEGGLAAKTGLLREGDEILEVNGVDVRGKSLDEVCNILAAISGKLTFITVPNKAARNAQANYSKNIQIYIKALFDYDPSDDMYIPCKELGISFEKGDILIIKSQEDPNWWQAYRYGEHDVSLAGLIPSKSFQIQRDLAMKKFTIGDEMVHGRSQKSSILLCAKSHLKKKSKKHLLYQDGGYPLYSSTADEYDCEEIPTYEEVDLYYPRMNRKRPIVLIGPPNIGRHELRQRLMEDSSRFSAAVPHTSRSRKDGEIDGQDYHFITKHQFEADIMARKFVEHGEYEKAYYGTSLEAIRRVVSMGKICVLNLHAQSLRILRSSDLMPFVVYVSPPSLEKLRQKKLKAGETFKEEELVDIIEKGREMEDKYGHFFDTIIVNNDTEQAYHLLLDEINKVEREPQWVPAAWLHTGLGGLRNAPYYPLHHQ